MKRLEFGDMIFYSIAGLIVILLLWLRFVEETFGLWGAWVVWACWSFFLIHRFLRTRKTIRATASRS